MSSLYSNADLAHAWLRYQTGKLDNDWWAVDELMRLSHVDPERAWQIVLDLLRDARTESQRQGIGAGPLEDLLVSHEDKFVPLVASEANSNPSFATALKAVWAEPKLRHRLDEILQEVGPPSAGDAGASGD